MILKTYYWSILHVWFNCEWQCTLSLAKYFYVNIILCMYVNEILIKKYPVILPDRFVTFKPYHWPQWVVCRKITNNMCTFFPSFIRKVNSVFLINKKGSICFTLLKNCVFWWHTCIITYYTWKVKSLILIGQ